ncbi:Guanine nucleotide-binding protein alpha-2 subunit [Coemansia sp. RSA 1939]|nr:Guanine nucleotide-binding protein alpha-2 subunit [Coemansia sp. Benny D160-2]KAJ2511645.1 Guanine nucleotide-binding protein alpha-2 subunit [Coemansia sp. RSA 1939]KAJ2593433.1 Guanine nucleotide-binding protein alpha-2 subunit [Coemansia sp. RSA 1804]KAJ2655467.1 Guanine nucleotide-binding protein alpha-2 subunit [Coemansia sp. RSA 1285]
MGGCMSHNYDEEALRSAEIDRELADERNRRSEEVKILLLGSGESGKSTIVKQMKIIHQNGYTREELALFRMTIYKNVLDSAQELVVGMQRCQLFPTDERNMEFVNTILGLNMEKSLTVNITPEFVEGVERLWQDPIIDKLIVQSSKFYLMDSAPYFFNNIRRIGDPKYLPTEADVLRARSKTTGIIETRFTMQNTSIHMFDVGGQRSERKKWIHCFESVTSIIFCVALSEYDQVLLEESSHNRMDESLVLFDSVINSRWFLRTSIILFLNKIDVFRKKIKVVPLSDYYPEYTGGPDEKLAARFILWRFSQVNRANLQVYPHLTQATDTSNIRLVFAAVRETLLQNALKESGIL